MTWVRPQMTRLLTVVLVTAAAFTVWLTSLHHQQQTVVDVDRHGSRVGAASPNHSGSAGGAGSVSAAPPAGATQNPPAVQNPLPDADTQGFLNYQGPARSRGSDRLR
jgi:hypothetical protein